MNVALLRGINVGGKNTLPMAELVALFEAAGARDVSTYIQSGNVIYRGPATVRSRVERALEQRFGHPIPIVVRSGEALASALAACPFVGEADPKHLYLGFLDRAPSAAEIARLDPARSPPDRFLVLGDAIHLCFPNGSARSKLTNAYFDAALGVISTLRNLNTVGKLVELAR